MKSHNITGTISVILILPVLAASTIAGDLDEGDSRTGADHRFECGDDEPPTGPYLDYMLEATMNYDCRTKTLTPQESEQGACIYEQDHDGQFIPLYGFCIGISPVSCDGEPCRSKYKVRTLVASVDQWVYSWKTYYVEESGGELASCQDAPCYGPVHINPCVANEVVTYCYDGMTHSFPCPSHEITVRGELKAESAAKTVTVPESQNARLCF